MKNILTVIAIILTLPLAGQQFTIESVTDSTVALKETTIGQDSLESVTYLTGAIDSSQMENSLFGFIRAKRTGQARAVRQEKEYNRQATALNSLLNAFSDSLYFEWTQSQHAGQFLASGQLPNFRIRIGSSFYWAKTFIPANNVLRLELTDQQGRNLSPRDLTVLYINSTESFRLQPLSITGEVVEFYLDRQDSRRWTWEGEKQDGTVIRITQLLDR